MKLIIAGSRTFNDYNRVIKEVDEFLSNYLDEEIIIVSGCARGADYLGERYAYDHNYKTKLFPANWEKLGRSAGYKRNRQMAEYANAAIVFWDGKSRGTKHMIDISKEEMIKLKIILI